jgi:hypothetical protein
MDATERRDLADERAADAYRELFEAEVERCRLEWIAEFGEHNTLFPFKPDGAAIHQAVMQQIHH